MLVAYNWEGCSSAPLTQYKNNEIYQEMTKDSLQQMIEMIEFLLIWDEVRVILMN